MQKTNTTSLTGHTSPTLEPLGSDVWRVAIAVVFGAFMSIIDTTIVNVALEQLGKDLNVQGFDSIQWVMTAYLLAVAAVIPITGWASERLGGRRLFLGSLITFTAASVLCATAWNLWSLVVFRVIQGLAGGALMPSGQILIARVAGPTRMGRVMAVIGVPMLLAPVIGPVLGGLILDSLAWEWIFLVNLPIGIIGFLLGKKLLPKDGIGNVKTDRKLDLTGLILASVGIPFIVYGVSNAAGFGVTAIRTWLPTLLGLLISIAFVLRSLRSNNPLLDMRLYRSKAFSYASATIFLLGAFLFGAMILLPLYFQVARHEDVLMTGLLLAPQGLGSALGISISGRLTDRYGGGIVTFFGLMIVTIGTIPFTQLTADTSYVFLSLMMIVRGIGFGSSMMPTMAAAYATLQREEIAHATPQLNVLQRVGGAVGTALFATILQSKLSTLKTPASDTLPMAFNETFYRVIAVTLIAFLPVILLARSEIRSRRAIINTPNN